ncbi:MAG TPA: pyridoxamine 5'-phosphate oxidase family protein [Actinomycetota bacterium]|nr:pyridoxamine 5'-phosphate oxidase family protein [Actinomycetota bacterium]
MKSDLALVAMAKRVIDGNRYMVIATAGDAGEPWVTPVYFNPDGYKVLYWISSPEALHSRNLALRPDASIVVFDSQVPIGGAEAVYMRAYAEEISEPSQEECAHAFRPRFEGVEALAPADLRPPALFRLFRATVSEHWVLIRGSDPDRGSGVDARMSVDLG